MSDELRLILLGNPQVTKGGVPVTSLVYRKSLALLSYIAVTGRSHSRDTLIGLFWADATHDNARASLRKSLVDLRRELSSHVVITRNQVLFNRDAPYWLDVEIFEASVAEHSHEDTIERLNRAVELYRGDFLDGFYVRNAPAFEEWVLAQRTQLHETALQALERLVAIHGAQGAFEDAIAAARRFLTLEPWREEMHRQLMLLLARDGRRGAALAQYEACRQVLAQELEVEPASETTQLWEKIRAGELELPVSSAVRQPASVRPGISGAQAIRGYQLHERIYVDSFHELYRAYQPSVGREVAVKVILPQYASDPAFIDRFETEAQLVARLEHPHIVPLYDCWRDAQRAYLVMRWLRGGDLLESIQRGPWALEDADRLLDQIASALMFAHHQGVVHRNVRPENIVLDRDGNAYLSDFGIARDLLRLNGGAVLNANAGSRAYISPEQAQGQAVTPQSDIYSLGIVMYHLLAGDHPFPGLTPGEQLSRQLSEPLPRLQRQRPDAPEGLNDVLQRATTRDPSQRYPEALAFAVAFREALSAVRAPGWSAPVAETHPQPPAFLAEESAQPESPRPVFVAREPELAVLNHHLGAALDGRGNVIMVTGEAGSGKTSLIHEFARRAQESYPQLIVATGECVVYAGSADPYLPFRDLLRMLTADVDTQWAAGIIAQDHARRLWYLLPRSVQALVEHGPHLIDTFVPGRALESRAVTFARERVEWLSRLRELMDRKDALVGEQGPDQQRVFEEYADVLTALAAGQPLLLVLDDLHWADLSSISLFSYLMRRTQDSRVLIVGSYRPEDVAQNRDSGPHPLVGVVSEIKRQFATAQINLDRAERAEAREFVDALLDADPNRLGEDFRQRLLRHTSGHPLFTVETLRDMRDRGDLHRDEEGHWVEGPLISWDELPERVDGVIEKRIDRLGPELRDVLAIASVQGETFSAEVVAVVLSMDVRRLVPLLSGELGKQHRLVSALGTQRMGSGGGRVSQYRFRHNLIQKYVYHSLDDVERAHQHEAVGMALEELYGAHREEITVQLARHFEDARIPEKAIVYFGRAGDAAARVYANAEAIAHYRRALELAQQADVSDEQLIEIFTHLGRTLELDSQFDEALATYEEMAGLTDEPSIELASLMARVTIYAVPTSVHNSAQALALGERALALARELSDQQAEAKILWSLSLANFFGSRAAQAIECGERSLALARELGLREQMAQTLNDLGSFCYLYSGSIDRAKSSLREASDLWRELGNLPMLADSLSSSCVTCVYGGEYDQAVALSEEALQISQSIDNLWGQSYSQWLVGVAYWERGEFSRAIAVMEESIRLGELAGFVPPQDHTRAYLAALYGDLGALDRGLEAVRLALSVAETKNPTGRIHALGILAHLYQMSGELTKAARVIEEGKLDPYREAWPVFYISVVVAEAELALKLADYERAVDVTDTLLARLAEFGMRAFTPYARYLQGQALLGLNRKNTARERWLESRDEAEAMGSRRTLWRVLNALSQLEGDPTEAERLRQEAQHVIEYIAERIDCAELRESFLNLPDVQAVLEPASDD